MTPGVKRQQIHIDFNWRDSAWAAEVAAIPFGWLVGVLRH